MSENPITPNTEQSENKPPKQYKLPEELQPIIDSLPDPQRQAVEAVLLGISIKRESFRSPLPPPVHLRQYNEIIPDGADRILRMAEKQSEHRIEMEKEVITREIQQSGRGQNYAFVIALAFLIVSGFLIYSGHEVAGTVMGTVDLVALVSVFIIGKVYQKRDLNNK